MYVSKLELSDETAHQKSTQGKILEWMQKYPAQTKNTSAAQMAKTMELGGMGSTSALRQAICKMVNSQMLGRIGGKRHAKFYINYLHKDIPPYILENAPSDAKQMYEDIKKGLEKGQHIDGKGCVVTKANSDKKSEDKEEPKEEPKEETKEEEEYPELDEIIEHITAVPVAVRKKQENGAMNISITLNLNLNN